MGWIDRILEFLRRGEHGPEEEKEKSEIFGNRNEELEKTVSRFYLELANFWGISKNSLKASPKVFVKTKITSDYEDLPGGYNVSDDRITIAGKYLEDEESKIGILAKAAGHFLEENIKERMGIVLTHAQKVREQHELAYLGDFFGSISKLYILERYNTGVFRALYDRYIPHFNSIEKNKENLERDLDLLYQEQTKGTPPSELTKLHQRVNEEISYFYRYPIGAYYFEIRKLPRKERYKLLAARTQAELVEILIAPQLKKLEQVLTTMSGKETTEELVFTKEEALEKTVPQPKEIQKVEKTEDIFKEIDRNIEKEEEKRKEAEASRKRTEYARSIRTRPGESIRDAINRQKREEFFEKENRRWKAESQFKHFSKLNEKLISKQDDKKTELTREQKLKRLRDAIAMPTEVSRKEKRAVYGLDSSDNWRRGRAVYNYNWALSFAIDEQEEKLKEERSNAIHNAFKLFEAEIKSKAYKISIDLANFWGFNNDQKYMISKDQPKIYFDWGADSARAGYIGYTSNVLFIYPNDFQSIYTLVDHISGPLCEFLGEHILKNKLFGDHTNQPNEYIANFFYAISRLFILEKYYPKKFNEIYKKEILKAKEITKNIKRVNEDVKELEKHGSEDYISHHYISHQAKYDTKTKLHAKKREYGKLRIMQTPTFIAATQYYNIKNLKPEERHRLLNMNPSEATDFVNHLFDPKFKQPKQKSKFSKLIHRVKTQNIGDFIYESEILSPKHFDEKTIAPQLEKLQDVQEKILRKEQKEQEVRGFKEFADREFKEEQREQDEQFKRQEEEEVKKAQKQIKKEDEKMRKEEEKHVEKELDKKVKEEVKEDEEMRKQEEKEIEEDLNKQ